MTPILFSPGTKVGGFNTHGLGNIVDAASCIVTEAINGPFTASMTVPVDSKRYKDLRLDSLVLIKPNPDDEPQPFRVCKFSRPSKGLVTVTLQHWIYDLKGYPAAPFEAQSAADAVSAINGAQIAECPFTLSTDLVFDRPMRVSAPTSTWQLMGDQTGQLLYVYGGEWRYEGTSAQLLARRGADRGFSIRYGKNLVDLKQEEANAEAYSAVLPFWLGRDGTLVQGTLIPSPGTPEVTKILPLDLSANFQDAPSVSNLDTSAAEWVEKNDPWTPRVSLDVKFAQLADGMEPGRPASLDELRLGDTVHVYFERLGVDTTARVIEASYDALTEKFTSVKIGSPKVTVADTIADQKKEIAGKASSASVRELEEKVELTDADMAEITRTINSMYQNGVIGPVNAVYASYVHVNDQFGLILNGGLGYGENCGLISRTVKDGNGNNVEIRYVGRA